MTSDGTGPVGGDAPRIALFDYGAGNLHSLAKALEGAGARVRVTDDWDEALAADALVLPGVGAFGAAVRSLKGYEDQVRQALEDGLPCLGICLGMQLLLTASDEAEGQGIDFIPGRVRRLEASVVPQMGWNDVHPVAGEDGGSDGIFTGSGELVGYYANSFICDPEDPDHVTAWSEVDGIRYPAALRRRNTWAFQFHPEKSSAPGLGLVRNFVDQVRDLLDGGPRG